MEFKQPTYLVFAQNETEKYTILRSNLALLKDWEKGCFEIPLNKLEEFKITFGRGSSLEGSACKYKITKEEINEKNLLILDEIILDFFNAPVCSLKNYLENLENSNCVVLVDTSTKCEINVGIKDKTYYVHQGKNYHNTNRLLNSFIDKLEVIDVSNEKIFVDIVKLFDDKNIITQAEKSISKTYGLIKNQKIAAMQLAFDTAFYMSIGGDKFCERVLETLEYANKQKEWDKPDKQDKASYFVINVSKGITAGEGYDIYLELDNKANEQDAVDKAIEDCLFEEPEDLNNIFSVEKVNAETYQKLTGDNLKTFKIPVVFQSSGYVEVKSSSLEKAIAYAERNIDNFKLPTTSHYVEDSFEIDYGSLENMREISQNKSLSLEKRISEADKKKPDNRTPQNDCNKKVR